MLDDREGAAAVLAVDLEDDPNARRETTRPTFARLDDLQPRDCHCGSECCHRETPLALSSEQGCTMNARRADVNIE